MTVNVLGVGLPFDHPIIQEAVKSGNFPPPEKIKALLEKGDAEMAAADCDYKSLHCGPEQGTEPLEKELAAKKYDCVVIGFGIRGNAELTPWFEALVNAIVDNSPGTKVLFNTSPDSTSIAVKRWFKI